MKIDEKRPDESVTVDTRPFCAAIEKLVCAMLGYAPERVKVITNGTVRDGKPMLAYAVSVDGAEAPAHVRKLLSNIQGMAEQMARLDATGTPE